MGVFVRRHVIIASAACRPSENGAVRRAKGGRIQRRGERVGVSVVGSLALFGGERVLGGSVGGAGVHGAWVGPASGAVSYGACFVTQFEEVWSRRVSGARTGAA